MDFNRIYRKHTGDVAEAEDKVPNVELNSADKLAHNQWLAQPYTKSVINELEEKQSEFLVQALKQAKTFATHNNHQQIVYLLNQVNSIQEILEAYARIRK